MEIIIKLNSGKKLSDISDMINELGDHLKECYDDYVETYRVEK